MFDVARVLNAEDYDTASQPYVVQQVAAAALEELRRKRDPKSQAAQPAPVDPLVLRLREEAAGLRLEADRVLKEAGVKAETLLAEAAKRSVEQASLAKESATQEGLAQGNVLGFEQGEKKGKEEGLAAYADSNARLQALLESAKVQKEGYFVDREALLVEMAIRVSAKVIHREVLTRPDHTLNLLRQVARGLAEKSRLQVRLNPEDLELLEKAQAEGLLNLQGVKQIEFLADDKIVAGGLRITSGYQTLDATLDSQLAELCRGLLEEAYHDQA